MIKKRLIKIGDIIAFTNTTTNETFVYKNFEELHSHYDKVSIGYGENDSYNVKKAYVLSNEREIKIVRKIIYLQYIL